MKPLSEIKPIDLSKLLKPTKEDVKKKSFFYQKALQKARREVRLP